MKALEFFKDKKVLSWALYDWANSAFATSVMAAFFPIYFKKFWSAGVDPNVSSSRLAFSIGFASFIVAILAPFLGAIADQINESIAMGDWTNYLTLPKAIQNVSAETIKQVAAKYFIPNNWYSRQWSVLTLFMRRSISHII